MRVFLLFLFVVILAHAAVGADATPLKERSPVERLSVEHLRAVNEARTRFAKERSTAQIMPNGIYDDYRAVLNINADDAELPGVLAAAKKAGVRIAVLSGKHSVKMGLDDGLLLLPGSEEKSGVLQIGSTAPSFLTSSISFLPILHTDITEECKGFQICSRQKCETALADVLKNKTGDAAEWAKMCEAFKQYPAEFCGAGQTADNLGAWDSTAERRSCCCVANNGVLNGTTIQGVNFDSPELNFNGVSTHVLAREFNEKEIRKNLSIGRSYVSHDWLCDPTGFVFGAGSMLGTYVMGDSVPYYFGAVKLGVFSPLRAHLRILHDGKVVAQEVGNLLMFETKETGAFRAEAWLEVDGELRPWIYSNPIYLQPPSLATATILKIPSYEPSPDVIATKDVAYTQGRKEDQQKQQLDIFQPKEIPKDKKNLPVLMFVHGGSWRTGDRWQYSPLGQFLAQRGIVTFIPSYRLAGEAKYPAQIEDVAAAFKWVVEHCAEYGGDPERIYIGGHSAGGHLASLLLFDTKYLEAQKLSPKTIKGGIFLSGVYDLVAIGDAQSSVFGTDPAGRRAASPLTYVKAPAPRMLISCCQYDYLSLPQQAKDFYKAVKAIGADAEFLFVPGENHISEMVNVMEPGDLTGQAILKFIR